MTMNIPSSWVVLSFSSHRVRDKSGVCSRVSRSGEPIKGYPALYSYTRASKGGYYLVPKSKAQEVRLRCGARLDDYHCTLTDRHSGPHVACGGFNGDYDFVCTVWGNDEAS